MTETRANQIVAAVTGCHKQFRPRKTECITHTIYRVCFAPVSVDPRTVVKWFGAAGGLITQIGTDVGADEMYLYFRESTA